MSAPVVVAATDAAEFRRTMAEFASGVTVVTALDGQDPVGFACQSFASVSLEPPLVLFCVASGSRTWPRIRAAGRFCVNLLGEDQSDLCTRFGTRDGERFSGLEWLESPWRTPSLPHVLARIHAEVDAVHDGGDHDIVVGRVIGLERVDDGAPMVFFRGRFGLDSDDPRATQFWLDGWL